VKVTFASVLCLLSTNPNYNTHTGRRQAAINVAEGKKQSVILASEASKMEQINQAVGEAEAILARAKATAEAISHVSKTIGESPYSHQAMSLSVAEKYVEAWGQLAKEGTMVVVPQGTGDVASLISQVCLHLCYDFGICVYYHTRSLWLFTSLSASPMSHHTHRLLKLRSLWHKLTSSLQSSVQFCISINTKHV
jgi:hypothetical protein